MKDSIRELLTPDQVKEENDTRKEQEIYYLEVAGLLKNPSFLKFFSHLLLVSGFDMLSYSRDSSSHTAFLEGRRSIGLEMVDFVNSIEPEFFERVMKELSNARAKHQRKSRESSST